LAKSENRSETTTNVLLTPLTTRKWTMMQ